MDYLSKLENQSIYIMREAFNKFENLAMLWSIGKDSTVLLWLARKAFFSRAVPAGARRHDLQNSVDDRVSRPPRARMEARIGGRQERGRPRQRSDLPERQSRASNVAAR